METNRDNILSKLGECLKQLTAARQYEEVFDSVVYSLAGIYKSQTCAIILIDPSTEYLNIVNNLGLSLSFCNEYRKKIATGVIGKLIWTGNPVIIVNNKEQPEIASEIQLEHPFASCVCLPMVVNQRTIGYLYIDSNEEGRFSEMDIENLRSFADVAALAYFKYRITEDNKRLDTADRDTGAEKYTLFSDKLNRAFLHSQVTSEAFSIILLDVDNIKDINKTYGYDTGIKLMKELLEIIKSEGSGLQSVARYGFDEYILLLQDLALTEAVQYAKSLKSAVESKEFTDNRLHSSISVGVVSYPQNANTVDDLIISVKNALFEAQRAGTNCICNFEKEWYNKDFITITK